MSCITEILKRKGDREYLSTDRIAIESGGMYKGYEYLVTLTHSGYRCGYVAISKEHPFYGLDLERNSAPNDIHIQVHGGITFHGVHKFIIQNTLGNHSCEDEWIGFDAGHYKDGKDYECVKKAWPDGENYNDIIEIEKIHKNSGHPWDSYPAKSNSYMTQECINLIDQISKAA